MQNKLLVVRSGLMVAVLLAESAILPTVVDAQSPLAGAGCVPAPAGLVGWWRAEGDASDSAGANNGSIAGTVRFVPGEVGRGFEFDGATSAVTVPASSNLSVQSLTVEAWVFPYDTSSPRPIVEFAGPTGPGYVQLWYGLKAASGGAVGATGSLYGAFRDPGGAELQISTAAGAIPSNQWSHVALTFDAATRTSFLYVDGVNVASNSSSVAIQPTTSVQVNLGYRPPGSSELLAGARHLGGLDEVSIYNRVLTATEVLSIYNADDKGKCVGASAPTITVQPASQTLGIGATAIFDVTANGSQPLSYQWLFNGTNLVGQTGSSLMLSDVQPANGGNYAVEVSNGAGSVISANALLTVLSSTNGCVPPPSCLVSWWRAEGNAGDAVGTNDGTMLNGTTFATGEVGQAFALDGLSAAVRIPASTSLNVGCGAGFTLEAWVKPFDAGHGPIIEWSRNPGGAPYGVHLWVGHPSRAAGYFYANIADTNGNWHVIDSDPGLIQTNVFQHVSVTYDKATGLARLYLNGAVVRELNLGIFTPQTSYDLYLGERPPGDVNSGFFAGLIDEASVFSRALSPSEVQSIYSAGSSGKCTAELSPRACNINAGTVQNQPLSIVGQDLVVLGSPSGPALALDSVSATSTNGGAIALHANSVVYVPPANYVGADRFTYHISDGQGAAASAYVLVQVRPANIISANNLVATGSPSGFRVTFAGSPGHSYMLQRAPSVDGPWSNLSTVTVGPDGFGNFTDTALPSGCAFYRALSQ